MTACGGIAFVSIYDNFKNANSIMFNRLCYHILSSTSLIFVALHDVACACHCCSVKNNVIARMAVKKNYHTSQETRPML